MEERICRRCDTQRVDDERHFVMDCTAWNVERARFWQKIGEFGVFEGWGEDLKFDFIMTGGFGDPEFMREIFHFLKCIREEIPVQREGV